MSHSEKELYRLIILFVNIRRNTTMENIRFYQNGDILDEKLTFAVISSISNGKFVYVRHKDRQTWEIPGGRREPGETIDETAARELIEETGAKQFIIKPVCECSFIINGSLRYGKLYHSEIIELGELPNLEIVEVKLFENIPTNLTYPEIQPVLHQKAMVLKNIG